MNALIYAKFIWFIVIGILTFMVLVLVHEFGHFFIAKKSKVRVDEFGIGIPPRARKLWKDKSGTLYSLNRIPLGWFVKLKWEDPKEPEDFHAKDSFIKAPFLNKILIIIAGVSMNFIFAWLVFTIVFSVGVKPISVIPDNAIATESRSYLMPTVDFLYQQWLLSWKISQNPAMIADVSPDSLWSTLWLQSGDVILTINNDAVTAWNIWKVLRSQIGKEFPLQYKRGSAVFTKTVTCPTSECLLGILLVSNEMLDIKTIKFPFPQAMGIAIYEMGSEIKLTLNILWNFGRTLLSFNGKQIGTIVNRLTGPVGAIRLGTILLEYREWTAYLGFAGLLSLALAIFNILPIPALDWWRLLGILIQGIWRLKPEKYFTIEWYINIVFFVLLMWLGVYILVKDLIVFWGVHIPFLG